MTELLPACAALGMLLLYSGLTDRPGSAGVMARRLEPMIAEAGLGGLTPTRLVALSMLAVAIAGLILAGITGSLLPASAIAFAAGWAPIAYVKALRDKRRRMFRAAWPDALASLIAGIRAGVSLPEICAALAEKGPEELKSAFRAYAAAYRATGSFSIGLSHLRERMADPVADRVTAALGLAHEVGGSDLVRVLRTLSDFVREDLRIRKEIEARWSWTVTAARVAAGSPWIVLLLMSTRPEAAAAYDSATGGMVIITGAIATLIGYRLMLRAARLPEERRLGS